MSLSPREEQELYQLLEIEACESDVKYFFNNYVKTYDPRLLPDNPFIPMKLFPIQERFLDWLDECESVNDGGLVEKSRDMGVTWICSGYLVHHWLFRSGFAGGIGSRKEPFVDRIGDPSSIFEKMRMILRKLPKWMLPAGFDWNRHDCFCKLINPANGSVITGEVGDEIGRGGRATIYFVDEAASIERPHLVDASLSANTNIRIDVSTPKGLGNPFATKRFSGDYRVFTLRWQDDNRKNAWELVGLADGEVVDSGTGGTPTPDPIPEGCIVRYPWYEEMKRKHDPVTCAQEFDIDYTASLDGIAIPAKWVSAAIDLNKRIKMPVSAEIIAGLDVADGGKDSTVFCTRSGPVISNFHERKDGGTTDTAYWALGLCESAGAKYLNYDLPGPGSGIAGTFKAKSRSKPLGVNVNGVNTGTAPTEAKWPSGKTSKEQFKNLKAELWWIVRRRFEKTYEFVEQGIHYSPEELISIPNIPILIQQLSSVLCATDEAGKLHIESKRELAKRNVKSPDWAEALMLTFAPKKRTIKVAVGGKRSSATYTPR